MPSERAGSPAQCDLPGRAAVSTLSTITCPICGTAKLETMPADACQFFYACTGCGTLLRPRPGDCCVFCSYGDVACPPVQVHGKSLACGSRPGDSVEAHRDRR